MESYMHVLIPVGLALFGSSGICWVLIKILVKDAAKEALKNDLENIQKEIIYIKEKFVTCATCDIKHEGINNTLRSIDAKLDLLLQKGLH